MVTTYRRSLAGAIIAALSTCSGWAILTYDAIAGAAIHLIALVLAPIAWLLKAAKTVIYLDHPLHATRADDVRLALPFRAFVERARKSIAFVGDHFRTPAVCGT